MAGDGADSEDLIDATHQPRECMACRGTGRVISNLGGSASTVECPWCGGSGMRQSEVDAQAGWLAERAAQGAEPAEPAEAPGESAPAAPPSS
jgi:hypothetical protein